MGTGTMTGNGQITKSTDPGRPRPAPRVEGAVRQARRARLPDDRAHREDQGPGRDVAPTRSASSDGEFTRPARVADVADGGGSVGDFRLSFLRVCFAPKAEVLNLKPTGRKRRSAGRPSAKAQCVVASRPSSRDRSKQLETGLQRAPCPPPLAPLAKPQYVLALYERHGSTAQGDSSDRQRPSRQVHIQDRPLLYCTHRRGMLLPAGGRADVMSAPGDSERQTRHLLGGPAARPPLLRPSSRRVRCLTGRFRAHCRAHRSGTNAWFPLTE